MTREELKEHCEKQIKNCEMWATYNGEEPHGKIYEEHKLILELLEQEPITERIEYGTDGNAYRLTISNGKELEQEPILDKIRAEIEENYGHCDICEYFEDYDYEDNNISEYRYVANVKDILQIIDKYRGE